MTSFDGANFMHEIIGCAMLRETGNFELLQTVPGTDN